MTRTVSYLPSAYDEVAAPVETPADPAPSDEMGGVVRILLVDDEPVVRMLFELVLERLGYDVTAVDCGENALSAFAAADDFDVVVTDFVMPGMSGHELARKLRAEGIVAPILFVSGYVPDGEFEGDLDSSDTSFLSKPFTGDELGCRIRSLLDADALA